jgi:hypothetical protein
MHRRSFHAHPHRDRRDSANPFTPTSFNYLAGTIMRAVIHAAERRRDAISAWIVKA